MSSAQHYVPSGPFAAAGPSGSSLGTRKPPDDSDPDEPPKKKRRRQALTNPISIEITHPTSSSIPPFFAPSYVNTPCQNANDVRSSATDSNLAAPVAAEANSRNASGTSLNPCREKYVTRTEYDELKSRVEDLESLLRQIAPSMAPHHQSQVAGPSSTMHLTPGPPTDPIQGTQITPYHQAPITTGPAIYQSTSTPSRSSARGDPSSSPHSRVALPPRSPVSYSRPQNLPPVPPQARPMSSAHPQNPPPPPPRSSSISPAVPSSSRPIQPHPSSTTQTSTAVSRRASLSVPNLITPNPPDMVSQNQQSKNLRAQAPLPLGPRLRNTIPTGSAHPPSYPHLTPPITSPIATDYHHHPPPPNIPSSSSSSSPYARRSSISGQYGYRKPGEYEDQGGPTPQRG
ncbi:hypothetical protein QCA50_003483 [Cerrena zonata]|uniref:Uncharacterized protein n=1 Tax=Cerrena zonata TaxID=2478898 RepID=A0AAW0GWE7_9APHY